MRTSQVSGWLATNLLDPEFRKLYECELITESFLMRVNDEMSEQGVTRSELARRMGCSAANISQIMNGSGNMTVATMIGLSLALNLRIELNLFNITS